MFKSNSIRQAIHLLPRVVMRTVLPVALLAGLLAQSLPPTPVTYAAACSSTANCLSMMTLDEKVGQMTQANKGALASITDIRTYFLGSLLSGGGEGPSGSGGNATQWADMYDSFQAQAVQTRLGIPLIYGVDAVHGHNNVQGAVIFPHHIGMGATRNTALMQQADDVTRQEVLGTGMNWAFAPCVCVPRNDRWGRTYEGFSEDTALVSSMGGASIDGFQGAGLGPNTVMATAKHYIGDGGTTNGTDQGNTQITETELRAIHLPPYQTAIQHGVGSVMVSYSSWNGQKMHGNQYLITTVLKGELGFQGLIVSDWAGIDQLPGDYASDVRASINAGVDMVMVPSQYQTFISTLRNEVNVGNIPISRINDAVTRILNAKFALGLFTKFTTDRSYTSQVGSAAHRAVARQAVRESLVLLKNNSVLPLSKTATYKIVVGGSHVDNLGYQMGGWAVTWQGGSGATTTGTTFWQALQAAKPANVTLQNVGTNTASSYTGDIGIAVIGETPYAEGAGDSSTLALSAANVTQVSDICSRTTNCVVILISGRPMILSSTLTNADAFIAAWLPGTEGSGIPDVLFGDFNFTGKLPMTWPNSVADEPINAGDGKTPLFPFGFGMVYGTQPTPTNTPTRTNTPIGPTNTPTSTTTGGSPLPRTGWTATASSTETGGSPANALDGNATTRWSTGAAQANGQWFRVDMVTAQTFNKVVLDAGTSTGDYPRGYQLFVSNDGTNWGSAVATGSGTTQVTTITFANQTARYIRIVQTGSIGNWWSIHEYNVYGASGPTPTNTPTRTNTPVGPTSTPTNTPVSSTNLALNKPAASSSNENASLTPNLAVDGNTGTRWSSAFSDPQWTRIDLGATHTINRVVLRWEAAYGKSYQIQTSPDAITWTTIYSTTTGDGGVDDLTGLSGSGRYIRMNGTVRATPYGYSLWEFEAYGT